MRKSTEVYDFKAFGQTIKATRKAKGYTRERLGKELDIAPRYFVSIENEGQHPNLQVFHELVTFFDISVDQFFFPEKTPDKTTQRRQLDELLNGVAETDLVIVTDTVKGIQKAKEAREAWNKAPVFSCA